MKILKKILITLAIIIAIPLVIALFTKKEYTVEKEITINKPKAEVFEFVKQIKNQDQYSKWNMTDPNMKKDYKGTDGSIGFIYSWDSGNENVGKGEQEIIGIKEGEKIDMEIRFIKPFEGKANAALTTEATGEHKTKVKWSFNSKMPYPMNIMLVFMNMDEILGKDLETGLSNLKGVLEL